MYSEQIESLVVPAKVKIESLNHKIEVCFKTKFWVEIKNAGPWADKFERPLILSVAKVYI